MVKSAIVSGMGVALSIVQGLMNEVRDAGGNDEDVYRLAKPEGTCLLREFARIVVEAGRKAKEVFCFVVNYGRSVKELLKAGHYDYVNDNITEENFPVGEDEQGEKEVTTKLFHFNRFVESDEAIREMEKEGYQPGSLRELLYFGEKNPELQRQFPIVELRSVWVDPLGRRRVASLRSGERHRRVCLSYFGGRWDARYRFLGARK